jgi:hypothetical protein
MWLKTIFRTKTLLPHFILLGVMAILSGIVHQLSSWNDLPSIDPGLIPFAVMFFAGFLIASVSTLFEGAVAGLYVGVLVALSGILYGALAGSPGVTDIRTPLSYFGIMTCLGPIFGVVGGVPGTLFRHWVEHLTARKHPEVKD